MFGLLSRERDVLVLALPLFLYGAVLILSDAWHQTPRLRVSRSFDAPQIYEDERVDVTLAVTNEAPHAAFISLRDTIPNGLSLVSGETALGGRIEPGGSSTRTYTLSASRGGHTQRQVLGAAWAPWGLGIRDLTIRTESRLTALPLFETLREIEIRPRRFHAFAGSIRTDRSGSGLEVHGCREYALGDDIRRINWRASARREEVIVNLFEQERMTDVNIIVDARAHMHLQVGETRTFDRVVRAAASVASSPRPVWIRGKIASAGTVTARWSSKVRSSRPRARR